MNYKATFEEKTDRELSQMLASVDDMNYDALKALYEVIKERKGYGYDQEWFGRLEKRLQGETDAIQSLKYLKNLGFELNDTGAELKLTRAKLARRVDVVALVVGFLMSLCLIGAITTWQGIFNGEVAFASIMVALILSVLGSIGLALLIRAVNRIMEYRGFELVRSGKNVILRKTQDLATRKYDLTTDSLALLSQDKSLQYVAKLSGSDETVPIITVRGGLYKQATLKRLAGIISGNS